MGNTSSCHPTYAVAVTPPESDNRSAVYRAATHPDDLLSSFTDSNIRSSWELFLRGASLNMNGRCLGRRVLNTDGSLGPYDWVSYQEVELWAIKLGSALMEKGLVPTLNFPEEKCKLAQTIKLIGICAKNRVEWFVTEQACNAFAIAIVPFYDTLSQDVVSYTLEQTKMVTAFCSLESVEFLAAASKKSGLLKNLICYDNFSDEFAQKLKDEYGITLFPYEELIAHPKVLKPAIESVEDSIATICYTSGTTGYPKGVLISQRNFAAVVCACLRGPLGGAMEVTYEDVYLSYLPLAHVFERSLCSLMFASGASIGVFSGNVVNLLNDLKELKPSQFISVPRLFNRINDKVLAGVQEKSSVAQYLFNAGLTTKLKKLRTTGTVTHAVWDGLVFDKVAQLMGGRLRYMLTGGAPLDALVEERMKVFFSCPLMGGYGLSETLGASFITNPKDPVPGHVGGVVPCLEFVIESVPEMNYLVTDSEPRGELFLRGPGVCQGYFLNAEEWDKVFDKDRWLHTGDIVVLLPSGGIKIIDRRRNIFKLSQGEYVAPERIEAVYQQVGLVAQIFVYGNPTKAMLVAIIVPDAEAAEKWAISHGLKETTLEFVCAQASFKAALTSDLEQAAINAGLKGYEKVKSFTLWTELFSVENGLLTPTFKLKRHEAREKFQQIIDDMYLKAASK